MQARLTRGISVLWVLLALCSAWARGQEQAKLTVHWDKVVRVSQTQATLQVVVNPPLRRGTKVHHGAFAAVRELQAEYVRYVPWLPYPRLGVAELEAPKDGKTSWDFSLIDPMTIDFLQATRGHEVIVNFSTIPQWMFKTEKPVEYPNDPDQVTWDYEQGTELRDSSGKEVAEYYARLLSWYTNGGFTDEFGKRHESGYHYAIPYWEVLNEPDIEHKMRPETYARVYDAVVEAMRGVDPKLKFVGMALALPSENPAYFEYFLDHKNHKPGIPLDFISYHFYAGAAADQTLQDQQFTAFAQAEAFVNTARYIEQIRKRLSPETRTTVDEIGTFCVEDSLQQEPGHVMKPIDNAYWNLSAAVYAYVFAELTRLGIEVAGESQLVGYPTQFPGVSMVDWTNGRPNARFWALKLLKDNFGPGDKVVESDADGNVAQLAVVKPNGEKKVLVVNERDRDVTVVLAGAAGARVETVDQTTAFSPAVARKLESDKVVLKGFGVAAVMLP